MSQVTGTQFQGLGSQSSMSQGPSFRVLGVWVPCHRVPESQGRGSQGTGPGSQGTGPGSQGPRVPGLRS